MSDVRIIDAKAEHQKLQRRAARRPKLQPTMHIELAEMAHNSRVIIKPGADDWFGDTDISNFVYHVEIDAKVGDATRTTLRMYRVATDLKVGSQVVPLVPEITLPRGTWRRRWLLLLRRGWRRA